MFRLLVFLPLVLGMNLDGLGRRDTDVAAWKEIKEVLPPEYVNEAEKQGLSSSKLFFNTVIRLTYDQVVQESEALAARQQILREYVDCSCPRCPGKEEQKSRTKREAAFDPLRAFSNFLEPCESDLVLKAIKLLRLNLARAQLTYQQLVTQIACNCPNADKCRGILDPLVFSIISGKNDTELNRAYWQTSLRNFPQLMEKSVMSTLTGAASAIAGYVFNSIRGKPMSTPPPVSPQPAPPSPPSIFVNGQEPASWLNGEEANRCSNVHINITNTKNAEKNVTRSLDNDQVNLNRTSLP